MNRYILHKHKTLGRVKHHVIQYEIQSRGSVHAHVILWVDEDDIEQTTSEIVAHIPVAIASDNHASRLRDLVLQKQTHVL